MYKVTIIIPHKNIPSLLQRCIDSIPDSDDIKIVVVDDNSNPDIVDFNHFPGNQRKNVFPVYLKKSVGGGGARNAGLKFAEGRWLMFADSDDFFHESLLPVIERNYESDADLIVFETDSVMSDTLTKVDNRENMTSLYKKTYDKNILRYCHHTVWGKIFKLSMIKTNNITFQEVAASNDAFFAIHAGYCATKVMFISDIVYCCTVRRGSICTRLTENNVQARRYVAITANKFLNDRQINPKYWMNQLGPIFNLRRLSLMSFIKAIISYLVGTPFSRIKYDIMESGGRFWGRMNNKVNDRDIKRLQKYSI